MNSQAASSEVNIQAVLKENRTLKASINEGMCHAAMLGSGETYLNPFAVFLNGSSFQIGLLASLPLLVGSIMQIAGVWLTENMPSRLKIVSVLASVQALVWIPIALVPFIFTEHPLNVNALIFFAVVYQVAGSMTSPAWNSLIGDSVPIEYRGNYFGFRNRQTGLATFIAMISCGQVLHVFTQAGYTLYGYIIIFFIALITRLTSVRYLKQYNDIPYQFKPSDRFSFLQFLLRTPKSNYARFVFFFACMNFSAFLASPYFAMYLLNDVKASYFEYTMIIATVTIVQFLAMQYWGILSDRFGNRAIMRICGCGVVIVPFLWLLSANTYAIILIQAFGGFVWAGFNLAGANFMFDAVSPPKRARCVAYQAIINSVFVCMGALAGSFLAESLAGMEFLSHGIGTPKSIYLRLFTISGIMRLLVLLCLLRLFKEVRSVEHVRHRDLIFRITSLRPLSGVGFGIISGMINSRGKKRDK